MSSPCVKHLLEELRHFKWLWLKYRKLAEDSIELLSQADTRDIEDGPRKAWDLENREAELDDVDREDFEEIGGYLDD